MQARTLRLAVRSTPRFPMCLALSVLATACSSSSSAPPEGGAYGPPDLGLGGPGQAPVSDAAERELGPVETAGYVFLSKQRLDELRKLVVAEDPRWETLKRNVDEQLGAPTADRSSAQNAALVFLLTEDTKYAKTALRWARHAMSQDIRSGRYLYFGDLMAPIAMTLGYCHRALSEAERKELADYMDKFTNELWFDNQMQSWGVEDPGNNYHYAFLEGTAYVGYTLKFIGDKRGQRYIDHLIKQIEKDNGVLDYLRRRGKGGDWHEGTNYGQRTKQRMFSALSIIAAAGDKNYYQSPGIQFFPDVVDHAIHQIQPGSRIQYPAGDLARDSRNPLSAYDRDVIQQLVYWLGSGPARQKGQWYLNHIVPSYDDKEFAFRAGYYKDLLFGLDLPELDPRKGPTTFVAEGTGFLTARSSWQDDATCFSLSAPSIIDQTHAHFDTGHFTLWNGDWQIADASTYSRSGILWQHAAHNIPVVHQAERQFGHESGGLLVHEDHLPFTYAKVDGRNLFVKRDGENYPSLVDGYTRELVFARPNALVVYDRIAPKAGQSYDWRVHFPSEPTRNGNALRSQNGPGAVSVQLLKGQVSAVKKDDDIEPNVSSYRAEASSSDHRFVSVYQTARGGPPKLYAAYVDAGRDYEGARLDETVFLFRRELTGAAGSVSADYQVDGAPKQHVITGVKGSVSATITSAGSKTKVRLRPGNNYKPSRGGVIVITP